MLIYGIRIVIYNIENKVDFVFRQIWSCFNQAVQMILSEEHCEEGNVVEGIYQYEQKANSLFIRSLHRERCSLLKDRLLKCIDKQGEQKRDNE